MLLSTALALLSTRRPSHIALAVAVTAIGFGVLWLVAPSTPSDASTFLPVR